MHVWATTHYPGTAQHQALPGATLDFYVADPRVGASAGPGRTEGSPEGRSGMDAFDNSESTVSNSDGRLRATVATVRACDTLSSATPVSCQFTTLNARGRARMSSFSP